MIILSVSRVEKQTHESCFGFENVCITFKLINGTFPSADYFPNRRDGRLLQKRELFCCYLLDAKMGLRGFFSSLFYSLNCHFPFVRCSRFQEKTFAKA